MKKAQRIMLYTILGVEVVVFAGLYVRGPQGLQALDSMRVECDAMHKDVQELRQEVATLKEEVDHWEQYPFHKEKIAREQLQMARTDDEVFYLT